MRRAPHRNRVSLLIIISLVMGFGAYAFNYAKWLAHELDQDHPAFALSGAHDCAASVDHDDAKPAPLSDAQHQLVHTVDHGQPPLLSSLPHAFGESPARAAPLSAYPPALPPAEPETPFRPPRSTFRI
ncbi:MAG TPA: hypothetical protein VER09_01765 [Pseudomonas sp.]|nr:hypothetical protein [Pseudomonas sp.]